MSMTNFTVKANGKFTLSCNDMLKVKFKVLFIVEIIVIMNKIYKNRNNYG